MLPISFQLTSKISFSDVLVINEFAAAARFADEFYLLQHEIFGTQASNWNHLFMPSAAEHRYASHRLFDAVDAATVLSDRNPRIGDLPRARLAPQL